MATQKNRAIIIGVGIIISFSLLVLSISLFYNYQHDIRQDSKLTPELVKTMSNEEISLFITEREATSPILPSFYILPFIAFIGLLVGTIVYYIMSDKVIKQTRSLKNNSRLILNFLSGQERKVIEILMANDGRVQQYELSHLPNLNKVKTHRILVSLEQKGIITKEKLGKINRIVLNKDLYDVLR